jgi:single-strand selective monofunctional uracil DNA glycosylase
MAAMSAHETADPASALLIRASRQLARKAGSLRFHAPVRFVYNPLIYARSNHETYVKAYARRGVRVLFLGMNPGPWGMAQTGVPFGEVAAVRGWLGIGGKVGPVPHAHPRLPVSGLDCGRSEVSGRRFWGLMSERFPKAEEFFRAHFVANYCPLLFLDAAGRNVIPAGVSKEDRPALFAACDAFLCKAIEALSPEWIVGIGRFAEGRISAAASSCLSRGFKTAAIPHPSPANPRANLDWSGQAARILEDLKIW